MRWIGGCASETAYFPVPTDARLLWTEPPLWTVGAWQNQHIRTFSNSGIQLAVIGPCSASGREMADAVHTPDLTTATAAWAGSFTAVRHRRGTVEVVTDISGACPVYTTRTSEGLVVWGSSSRALAALIDSDVDPVWLSAYLSDKHATPPGRSAWAGVALVPPGHRLVVDKDGMTLTRWWSPTVRTSAEAVERVREALVMGVRSRALGVPMSTDLAGVDSTALAIIAAEVGPVTGVTAHPEGVTSGGDLDYVRALDLPGLICERFAITDQHLPFSPTANRLPATDEPPPSAVSWAAFAGQLSIPISTGAVCHLTGDGGDNLFLPPPTHLADLARNRYWVRLWRDACGWARLRRRSPWPYARAALTGNVGLLARSAPAAPPWLDGSAPERAEHSNADQVLIALVRSVARAAASDSQLADHLGLEQHNPYFDGAVLDAVVSLPATARFSVDRYKPALMDAIGDLLPSIIRERTTKGTFVADYHRGIRANLSRVLQLCEGPLADMGLVDPATLRTTVHAAALGARVPWAHLVTTLGAQMWLHALLTTSPPRWDVPRQATA